MERFETIHEEWLQEQGFGDQGTATALKRQISGRLLERMGQMSMDRYRLSERLQTSAADVDRLLDPENDLISLRALYRAAQALDCRLKVDLV